jgi:hypothetical protein
MLIGNLGGEYIRESLSSRNPGQVIAAVQSQYSLATPIPALPLLDLHGIERGEVFRTIMVTLRDNLLQSVSTMSQANLDALLTASLPYVHFPDLWPVVAAVLEVCSIHSMFIDISAA